MKRIILILFLLLWATTSALAQDAVADIVGRMNALRGSKGLPAYTVNGALAAAAQSQAQW